MARGRRRCADAARLVLAVRLLVLVFVPLVARGHATRPREAGQRRGATSTVSDLSRRADAAEIKAALPRFHAKRVSVLQGRGARRGSCVFAPAARIFGVFGELRFRRRPTWSLSLSGPAVGRCAQPGPPCIVSDSLSAPTVDMRVRDCRCFRFEGAHKLRPVCRHRCNAKHCYSHAQASAVWVRKPVISDSLPEGRWESVELAGYATWQPGHDEVPAGRPTPGPRGCLCVWQPRCNWGTLRWGTRPTV